MVKWKLLNNMGGLPMSNVADQQKIRQVVADAQKKGVPEFDLITEADAIGKLIETRQTFPTQTPCCLRLSRATT